MNPTAKQFIYGSIYLIILAAISYGVYFLVIYGQPASCFDGRQNQGEKGIDCGNPCAPCGLEFVRDIATTTPQVLEIDSSRVSVLSEIKNLNQDFGAEEFSYDINFYDFSGNQIKSVSGESFIYPGEIKNIIEPLVTIPFNAIARSELIIEGVNWIPAEEFIKPATEIRELKTESIDGAVAVRGLLINNSAFQLKQIKVFVLVFNRFGLRLGISRTSLQDIGSFGQRTFSVTVPVGDISAIDANLTKVFIEAKY